MTNQAAQAYAVPCVVYQRLSAALTFRESVLLDEVRNAVDAEGPPRPLRCIAEAEHDALRRRRGMAP